jgi:Asp/Glu/hydantoin racemase
MYSSITARSASLLTQTYHWTAIIEVVVSLYGLSHEEDEIRVLPYLHRVITSRVWKYHK